MPSQGYGSSPVLGTRYREMIFCDQQSTKDAFLRSVMVTDMTDKKLVLVGFGFVFFFSIRIV